MHIAFWSPAWPIQKFHNGIITYVHWMKCELESQGHLVSVFTSRLDDPSEDPNVHLVRRETGPGLPGGFWKHVRRRGVGYQGIFDFGEDIARAMTKVHRQHAIDIVEMEESFGWFADVARLTSLPLLVKLHGPAFLSMTEDELTTPLARKRIETEGKALQQLDSIVAPSELILRQTIERYGLQPRYAQRIVNPLVMDGRTPLWERSRCDANRVLFVGRFDLRKGGDVALKAFASALSQNENLKMVFVGPDSGVVGPNGTRMHFNEFCDSFLPQPFRAQVDFMGHQSNDEIMTLRTQSALTMIASRWENQGYTLLEAMFQGCPVVSADSGGCPESIIDGVTGLLAKSEDHHSFSRQMLALIEDPLRAESLGHAARQHVIKEHAAHKVVESSLEIYNRVIADHRL